MINGSSFRNALISGANNIISHKSEINALNIFPVPDGDTGTNMSMTIDAAVRAFEDVTSQSISENAAIAASAMLKGARGNSGVILSLLFRGTANGLKDKDEADGRDIVSAFHVGVEMAYKAVTNPTEGTILTVARMALDAGRSAAQADDDAVLLEPLVRIFFQRRGDIHDPSLAVSEFVEELEGLFVKLHMCLLSSRLPEDQRLEPRCPGIVGSIFPFVLCIDGEAYEGCHHHQQ